MDQALSSTLANLPRLDPSNRQTAPCKVCGHLAVLFDVVDFNKTCSQPEIYPFGTSGVQVPYLCCSVCRFIFTTFLDDWTPEDFSRFIYNSDYINVDAEYAGARPEREASAMALRLEGRTNLRILDYGSGSGLFAAGLRSRGFDAVDTYDPFSSPTRPDGLFDVITCFEVLEHSVSPRETLADIAGFLSPGGCILLSTSIQPPDIEVLRANWWYVAPRNGHVSIYSMDSLARLGRQLALTLYAGEELMAYAESAPSAVSREILAGVGSRVQFFVLWAPSSDGNLPPEEQNLWHEPERLTPDGPPFRWTARSDVAWTVNPGALQPGEITINIPVQNEVQPGFIDHCRVQIGDQSAPLTPYSDGFRASLTIHTPIEAIVRLVMPPLLRPCDLRPVDDERLLGLAIATDELS